MRKGRWLVDAKSGEKTHKLKASRIKTRDMSTEVNPRDFSSDACACNFAGSGAVVKPVNFVLYFRGEANSV